VIAKKFKIGEYAIGGTIVAIVDNNGITLECRHYYGNGLIYTKTTTAYEDILLILHEWTSSYYAEQIIDWIKTTEIGGQLLK
jgi:hypothetical protein